MEIKQVVSLKHHFPTPGNAVYIREMHAPGQYIIGTHKHVYDHFAILARGTVTVTVDGVSTGYTGPCVLEIKAGQEHKITAHTDFSWFCIHHATETDETSIDEVLIQKEDA